LPAEGKDVATSISDELELRLRSVRDAAQGIDRAVTTLNSRVADARASGATWTDVAGALGITRQAAWERFNKVVRPRIEESTPDSA
jgi:hypothetical protein